MLRTSFKRIAALLIAVLVLALPLAVSAQALTQTYTDPTTGFTINYPEGWAVGPSIIGIAVASSQEALDYLNSGSSDAPPSGMAAMLIYPNLSQLGMDVSGTPESIAQNFMTTLSNMSATSGPDAITLGGNPAAVFSAESSEEDAEARGYVIKVGDEAVLALAVAKLGELDAFAPTLEAILNSYQGGTITPQPPTDIPVLIPTETKPPKGQPTEVPPPTATPGVLVPTSQSISYGQTVDGSVTTATGQSWTFSGAEGDAVDISVTSDSDTLIELYAPDGSMVTSDDDSGGDFNPLISNLMLPDTGEYTITVRTYSGEPAETYSLTLAQPEVPEVDIEYGQESEGTLGAGESDEWVFRGNEGDLITAGVTANYDSRLELRDASGNYLASDDDSGGNLNPLIRGFSLPDNGYYTLVVTAFSSDSKGPYTISLEQVEAQPPQPIELGEIVNKHLDYPAGDQWLLDAEEGDVVTIIMSGDFDTYLELYDENNEQVAYNDDLDRTSLSGIVDFEIPADGTYRIVARSYGTSTGNYILMVGTSYHTAEEESEADS
jgi:hypothetical protein